MILGVTILTTIGLGTAKDTQCVAQDVVTRNNCVLKADTAVSVIIVESRRWGQHS